MPPAMPLVPLRFYKTVEIMDMLQPSKTASEGDITPERAIVTEIPRIRLSSDDTFEEILKAGKPVIIEGSNLGTCVRKWTAAYLNEMVGPHKKVSAVA
jgi:tRNA wybutosine-synthesizing protein 4